VQESGNCRNGRRNASRPAPKSTRTEFCTPNLRTVEDLPVPNPKQNGASISGRAGWYPYYAGFCPRFAADLIRHFFLQQDDTIIDPWNGAGTTTQVAVDLGHNAAGFDLNPALAPVARARLLTRDSEDVVRDRLQKILRAAKSFRTRSYFKEDPLTTWFSTVGVLAIRHLDRAINECSCEPATFTLTTDRFLESDTISSFFYTATFRVLRDLTAGFRASNPTWVKSPRSASRRLPIGMPLLLDLLSDAVETMLSMMNAEVPPTTDPRQPQIIRIGAASSTALPFPTGGATLAVGSPPYCTRIDYAVSTAVELALLGVGGNNAMRSLRDAMTGTSTIRATVPTANATWGPTCQHLLKEVYDHSSRASRSYYLKTLSQYFHDIYCSLAELKRCVKSGGHCVLVVQNSYYKEVPVNLDCILTEMGDSFGWRLASLRAFPVSRSMRSVNSRSQQYRSSNISIETVLCFAV
jgi:hypothetical protein